MSHSISTFVSRSGSSGLLSVSRPQAHRAPRHPTPQAPEGASGIPGSFALTLGVLARLSRSARRAGERPLRPWQRRLPNVLTILRVLAVLPVMVLFYVPWQHAPMACAYIFAAASLTDWIDGYLARRWKVISRFGQFLDPVADKLLACAVLVVLPTSVSGSEASALLAIPAVLIILREVFVSALREWTASVGESGLTQVGIWGKLKTAVTLFSLCGLLATRRLGFESSVFTVSLCLLYVATLLAYVSVATYVKAAMPAFTKVGR